MRFERMTHALEGRCSIQLSYGTILNCGAKIGVFLELCKHFVSYFINIFSFMIKHAGYEYFLGNLKRILIIANKPKTSG